MPPRKTKGKKSPVKKKPEGRTSSRIVKRRRDELEDSSEDEMIYDSDKDITREATPAEKLKTKQEAAANKAKQEAAKKGRNTSKKAKQSQSQKKDSASSSGAKSKAAAAEEEEEEEQDEDAVITSQTHPSQQTQEEEDVPIITEEGDDEQQHGQDDSSETTRPSQMSYNYPSTSKGKGKKKTEEKSAPAVRSEPVRFTDEVEADIAEWYRGHEYCYNRRHPRHLEKKLIEGVITAKAKELNVTYPQLNQWLRGMRDRVNSIAKKLEKFSGDEAKGIKELLTPRDEHIWNIMRWQKEFIPRGDKDTKTAGMRGVGHTKKGKTRTAVLPDIAEFDPTEPTYEAVTPTSSVAEDEAPIPVVQPAPHRGHPSWFRSYHQSRFETVDL